MVYMGDNTEVTDMVGHNSGGEYNLFFATKETKQHKGF